MGTGYTRQSAGSIITGAVITSSAINAEFNQLEGAFNESTGHTHDGTAGEGPLINLTTSITGTLPVANGGTGATTLTDGGILLGSGTGAITAMSVLSDGAIVIGDGTTDPTSLAAFTSSTGTLKHESGGLEADVSAYNGILKIASGATSAIAAPTGAVVGTSDSQTLTNKTIDADSNTISNIENADIKSGAAIDAAKIHDGSVSNTEFGYLANVTSDIQTQLNSITSATLAAVSGPASATDDAIVLFDGATGKLIQNSLATINSSGDLTIPDKIIHSGDTNTAIRFPAADTVTVETAGAERVRVDSSGNVGIGVYPSFSLDVYRSSTNTSIVVARNDTSTTAMYATSSASFAGTVTNTPFGFNTNNAERMRITSSGNVGIGTSSPTEKLSVTGNVTISGSLSKGSGSFKIDHPIKPKTHHLVHSFIEGPQADNIYRGKAALVDGTATVNLDEAGRMAEGTFVALNGNVQCFTTNEDGWTAVRGKVDGNILTVKAQDAACTDTVSWLVIGERHDQHMIDANWTDEQGRIITEPEKVTAS